MRSEFGECPNCGTERMYASQSACATCGQALPVAEPARAAPTIPFSRGAPALPAAVSQPAPGLAAEPRRGSWLGLLALLAGLAVLCGGLALLYPLLPKLVGGGETSRGITFDPAAVRCSAPSDLSVTFKLPASVKPADLIQIRIDGVVSAFGLAQSPTVEGQGFVEQADGTWLLQTSYSGPDIGALCPHLSLFAPGDHVWQVVDADGHAIASGTLKIEP